MLLTIYWQPGEDATKAIRQKIISSKIVIRQKKHFWRNAYYPVKTANQSSDYW